MTFTVRTAQDADAARIDESWGSLTWLTGATIGNAEEQTVGRVIIKAGQCNPRHFHPNCEEVLYLISGTLEHTIEDKTVTLQAGDTLVVAKDLPHNAKAIGNVDADMIVIFSAADRQVVGE
jgi:quercetin dioxygenase-like cupin family protein